MSLQILGTFGASKGHSEILDAVNNLNNISQLRNSSSRPVKQLFANVLPQRIQDQIFFNIWNQAGQPPVANYGQNHAFDNQDQLKLATQQVFEKNLNATSFYLQSLPQEQQDMVYYKIWHQAGEPPVANYGQKHVFDDPFKLQQIIHEVLGVDQAPIPSLTIDEERNAKNAHLENSDNICTYSQVFSYFPTCQKPKHEGFEFCSTTHAVSYYKLCDRCHIWPKLESSGKVHNYCGNLCEQLAELQKK